MTRERAAKPGAGWRPTERQLHPLVQGALNRQLFRILPHHWLKEVELPRQAARGLPRGRPRPWGAGSPQGARLDLLAFVHRGNEERGAGVHAVEVKMGDDRDAARLSRQLAFARLAADFTWLLVVDGEPRYDEDPAVGLLRYDLVDDRVTVARHAERERAPPLNALLLGSFVDAGETLRRRAEERLATRGRMDRRRARDGAVPLLPGADAVGEEEPEPEALPWEAEDPWEV